MRLDLLAENVDGVDEALTAAAALDRVLGQGLLRPQPAQAADLAVLAAAVAGTPLASRVAEAAEKASAGTAGDEHFLALAAARGALLGAVHDALLARADEATGRIREAAAPVTGATPPPNLLAAARSWLGDLARAGWQGMDHETVAGSAQIVSAMLPEPNLRRLATILDGFAAELAASCPGATLERIPARRWGDLWSRAMLLTQPGASAAPAAPDTATGRLLPLGIDLHEHATAASAQVHAVFEPADGGTPRLVRAAVSVPKPDTVLGAGIWQLLRPHMALLAAVGEGRAMDLDAMPLTAEGDLLWDDALARAGEPADAFGTARVALATAAASATAPLDRHPTRIAEPVFLEEYTVELADDAAAFVCAGHRIRVDVDRIPDAGPLTPEVVAASRACVGLLRWDAGTFSVQPLAVEAVARKKAVTVHAGAWAGGATDKLGAKAEKAATDTVTVLRERAGKLLRGPGR